jgi:uncharacterized protein YijF (DUF1287 family)
MSTPPRFVWVLALLLAWAGFAFSPAGATDVTSGTLIARAAARQVGITVNYDPTYRVLTYPNGDVPRETGVCADVVVRALRDAFGVDLQQLVHEDMARNFSRYPKEWGLSRPDKNIDHRRVPNLHCWFKRQGMVLPLSRNSADFLPGDIVGWQCGGLWHIGIVSDQPTPGGALPLIIHNIGNGAHYDALLYDFMLGDLDCKLSWHARWRGQVHEVS